MFKRYALALAAATTVCAAFPRAAAADKYKYDFALEKMFDQASPILAGCGGWAARFSPQCVADLNSNFRSLMSQMGILFAPQFLSPAETPGWHGFVLGFKYALTSLNDQADYWKYGVDGNPDPVASSISIEVRKGIWMPLPSFELGAGFTHLVDSHMFSVNIFAKMALHEGFHKWPTPAFAIRGYFQRILGVHQLDFTILSIDISTSKSFGIAGTFNLTPYLGYNVLWIIAKSEVIDTTPYRTADTPYPDALQCSDGRCATSPDPWSTPLGSGAYCNTSAEPDCNNYYVFIDQTAILRHRIFFGVRFNFSLSANIKLALSTEYSMTVKGLSDDKVTISGVPFPLKDNADMQHTWAVSVGFDY